MINLNSSNRKLTFERRKKNLRISDLIFENSVKFKNKSNYHWDDNKKLKKDLKKIYKIYY